MPTRAGIYVVARRFRQELLQLERSAASELVRYYGETWKVLQRAILQVAAKYAEDPDAGWGLLYEQNRLRTLQQQVEYEISRFARFAEAKIQLEQRQAVEASSRYVAQSLQAAGVTVGWTQLPEDVVRELIGHLQDGSPLRELLDALGPAASKEVRHLLVTGLATGKNPREIARLARHALGGNLTRALLVARTETLRAYREATRLQYQQYRDVVTSWVRVAACDSRTCPACFALHGSEHSLDEPFWTHPSCRCTLVAKTKTWAELGFRGIKETGGKIPSGETMLRRLPEQSQLKVLGAKGHAAWKAGKVELTDWVHWRRSEAWGRTLQSRLPQAAKEFGRQVESLAVPVAG